MTDHRINMPTLQEFEDLAALPEDKWPAYAAHLAMRSANALETAMTKAGVSSEAQSRFWAFWAPASAPSAPTD